MSPLNIEDFDSDMAYSITQRKLVKPEKLKPENLWLCGQKGETRKVGWEQKRDRDFSKITKILSHQF